MPEPTTAELRRSALIRVAISVVAAAAITAALIAGLWSELDIKTDVIGNPVFSDFNGNNYFRSYYLVTVFFPLAALGLFLLLTRFGPRFGLAPPPPRGRLHPGSPPPRRSSPTREGDPPLQSLTVGRRRVVAAARVGFPGAALGLEAGIVAGNVWLGLLGGIAIYGLAVFSVATVLEQGARKDRPRCWWLSAVNALAAPLAVLGLCAVSSSTEVRILADGSTDRYPWFPIWLALPVTAILVVAVASRLRAASGPSELERRVLLLIVGPLSLFLMLAVLPGNQLTFETFEAGQRLAAGRLVGDGMFPWRDVFVAHGLLADVVQPLFGFAVFDDSYWGDLAGRLLILAPAYLVAWYLFYVYLFGRNWLFLLICAVILLDRTIAPPDFRLILWPLILLLLASVLDRPTRPKAVALAGLGVGQALITPESAPALVGLAAVLIAFEWYWREPGTDLRSAFSRTIWFAGAAAVSIAVAAVFLALNHALDDLVFITFNLLRVHSIDGAIPPGGTVSDGQFYFMALAPPAALLIAFAYAVARLRLRKPFRTEDWVVGAVAIFVFFYYSKFLARMDDHVYQPFVQSLPLLLYIAYRAVVRLEQWIRERRPKGLALQRTAHPVTLLLLVGMVLTSHSWRNNISDAADRYSATAVERPRFDKVGYADTFEATVYRDLRRVVDTYLGPSDTLFDLTGEPGLYYYLMERDPSTRFTVINSVTDTADLQTSVIDQLREERPKLIVFDNTTPTFFGISNYDGTASMVRQYLVSQWILDRYRPLLNVHGHTFYVRRDQPPADDAELGLSQKPVTRGVEFRTQPCIWGYGPNFLSGPGLPGSGAISDSARWRLAPDRITVVGWAGDPKAKLPAREVIGTLDGEVVGRSKPQVLRPDLVAFGLPKGFERSGFQLQVNLPPGEDSEGLEVYAISRDGEASEIVSDADRPGRGTVTLDGRKVRVDPTNVYGQLNSVARDRSLRIEQPPGSKWGDYRWLEVASKGGFRDGTFSLYDRSLRPSAQREIHFRTLGGDRALDRYVVPVGSCAQWHGYRTKRLFLNFDTPQEISGVRLIR